MLYMTFVPGATRYSNYQHRLELVAGNSNLDENYLAAILLIGFGFVLYWLINQKTAKLKFKAIALLYCAGCIYYIFATGSRSGLIAAMIILIVVLAGNIKKNTLAVLLLALLVIVIYPLFDCSFNGKYIGKLTKTLYLGWFTWTIEGNKSTHWLWCRFFGTNHQGSIC